MPIPISQFWEDLTQDDKNAIIGYTVGGILTGLEGTLNNSYLPTNGSDTDNGKKALIVTTNNGTPVKVITRAINEVFNRSIFTSTLTNDFDKRLTDSLGNHLNADKTAFDALGSNIIQTVYTIKTKVDSFPEIIPLDESDIDDMINTLFAYLV